MYVERRTAALLKYESEHQGPLVLAIKTNNAGTNDPCIICGERTDPIVGPELFLDGTTLLVCYACGWEVDPVLTGLLESFKTIMRAIDMEKGHHRR